MFVFSSFKGLEITILLMMKVKNVYVVCSLFDFATLKIILVLENFSIDYDFFRDRSDRCSKILGRAFLDILELDFLDFENSRSRSRLDFFSARHITSQDFVSLVI